MGTLSGPIRSVEPPLTEVEVEDNFWSPRLEVSRTRTLDHVYKEFEATGCLRNFKPDLRRRLW
jgi:hypothetical protein